MGQVEFNTYKWSLHPPVLIELLRGPRNPNYDMEYLVPYCPYVGNKSGSGDCGVSNGFCDVKAFHIDRFQYKVCTDMYATTGILHT